VGTYVQIHASLPEKNIYFVTFWSPSDAPSVLKIARIDAASILKNPRIDAASEPEFVIKLIENCVFFEIIIKNLKDYGCTGVIAGYPYTDACNPIQVFTVLN